MKFQRTIPKLQMVTNNEPKCFHWLQSKLDGHPIKATQYSNEVLFI